MAAACQLEVKYSRSQLLGVVVVAGIKRFLGRGLLSQKSELNKLQIDRQHRMTEDKMK